MSSDFKWVAYFRRDVLASPNVRRGDATRSKIPGGVQVGEPQGRSGSPTRVMFIAN
jgi:hypothetical protein